MNAQLEDKKVITSLYIFENELNFLREEAKKEHRSITNLLAFIISEEVRQRKSVNEQKQ